MVDDFTSHFDAFALLDEDGAMKGFKRVGRCTLRDWDRLAQDPGYGFTKPFDSRFAKTVVKTLTNCFGIDSDCRFGFAEHDGFSVLLGSPAEGVTNGSRRTVSVLASAAAAKMSLLLGDLAIFDVCLYQFPSPELTRAYFQWRQQEHRRFALDRCVKFVMMKDEGDEEHANMIIKDFGDEEKLNILANHDFSFDALPDWQRSGSSIYWRQDGGDPGLTVDISLPVGDKYASYLQQFV